MRPLLRARISLGFKRISPHISRSKGGGFPPEAAGRSPNNIKVGTKLEGRAMNRIRQTISLAPAFAMLSLGLTAAQAQRRTYRLSDAQGSQLIRRVEMSTERFQGSLSDALDRGSYAGTMNAGDINNDAQNLQNAVAQLRDRFNRRASVAADVQNVLQQASLVNGFLLNNRMSARVQNDWSLVRSDLDALARANG